MSENPVDKSVNPSAMTVSQAARVLGVEADTVRRHIEQGLPIGSGGTINLVKYAAWMLREIEEHGWHSIRKG